MKMGKYIQNKGLLRIVIMLILYKHIINGFPKNVCVYL